MDEKRPRVRSTYIVISRWAGRSCGEMTATRAEVTLVLAVVTFVALFAAAVWGVVTLSASSVRRGVSERAVGSARGGSNADAENDDGGEIVVRGVRGVRMRAGAGARRRRGRLGGEGEALGGEERQPPRGQDAPRQDDDEALMGELRGATRRERKEEMYRIKREEREAREREDLERAEALRAEEEKKANEEYEEWKGLIDVEKSGSVAETMAVEPQSMLLDFIDHIKEKRVVILEELAAKFGLKTADAVSRVKTLQARGRLTGVMDDRGKFIYISKEEMESLASFINSKGRVSIAELTRKANELIEMKMEM